MMWRLVPLAWPIYYMIDIFEYETVHHQWPFPEFIAFDSRRFLTAHFKTSSWTSRRYHSLNLIKVATWVRLVAPNAHSRHTSTVRLDRRHRHHSLLMFIGGLLLGFWSWMNSLCSSLNDFMLFHRERSWCWCCTTLMDCSFDRVMLLIHPIIIANRFLRRQNWFFF